MSFTYNAGGGTDRDRLRLFLLDTKEGSGPLPQGEDHTERTNFSDDELDDILDYEGNLYRAMAHCLEILAVAWVIYPTFQGDGIAISRSHINRNFSAEAVELRKKHGWPSAAAGASAAPWIRVDGYNEDAYDTHELDS